MSINPKTKGASGEREIADVLNMLLCEAMVELQYPADQIGKAQKAVQRNQNQSAVGGCDLTNTFGLAIEVKRQETLSVDAWWRQTTVSALRNNETPVLVYRQNRKPWRVRLPGLVPFNSGKAVSAVVEISWEDFKCFFKNHVKASLLSGESLRI